MSVPPRPSVRGKFLFAGDEKLYVRGVTYGTFRPDACGCEYSSPAVVERDFAQMRASGINAVRTYTVPPRWLLDAAERCGLRVMVGLPWSQHVTFLDDEEIARDAEARVRAGVRACAGHGAVLCYAIGNEIPAPIVRWHGRDRVASFLERLYQTAKEEDPGALVTYVNYPTTEYLELPFLDLLAFNVYLESPDRLSSYLARLQNLAGDRPLLMAEIGLDSRRNGEEAQASALEWQLSTTFGSGCCGAFVFAWTDEWHRGGYDVEDWDFGLTTRDRHPKLALSAVRSAFERAPFPEDTQWPHVSVVVCSHNGAHTLADCLDGLAELDYPDYEVIVVNDGSTDSTPAIASRYPYRLISTANRGLSAARNVGLDAATGAIVAYTDDDARPDPHWLTYLVAKLLSSEHAGVGGPNIAPPGDGPIAACVANAPGGPVHVLLTDEEAEHVPGCNMAFRKERLEAIGGFDPRFRAAGDDVDVCWRLQERGWTLGFSPAAMVWHHRRNSLRAYWRQQQGYGKAEALLEEKWPEKYNAAGHLAWAGRLYGRGLPRVAIPGRGRIYGGAWGSAPFQRLYEPAPGTLSSMPLMPEWYLMIAALSGFSALGTLWTPLLLALPLLAIALAAPVVQAFRGGAAAELADESASRLGKLRLRALTALMHLLQPIARLHGRLRFGLTPWRRRGEVGFASPVPRTREFWSEQWCSPEETLRSVEDEMGALRAVALRGGEYDGWDLAVRGGTLGGSRLLHAVEEHGGGRQQLLFRVWPRLAPAGLLVALVLGSLCAAAALDGASLAAALLGTTSLLVLGRALWECGVAAHVAWVAVERLWGGGRG